MKPDSPETTTMRDYLAVLRRQRWVIIGTCLVATALGLAYSLLRDPVYDATATVDFSNPAQDLQLITSGTSIAPDLNPDKVAAADTRIVTRDSVINAVQEQAGSGLTTSELQSNVSATVQPDSNLIAIQYSNGDADLAARVANSFAQQTKVAVKNDARARYAAGANTLRGSLKGVSDPVTSGAYQTAIARLETLSKVADPVQITQPASVPRSPSSPKPVRDTLLALILGLIVGVAAAFLRNAFDRRIKDSHQIQHELGLSLVGYIRKDALGLAGVAQNGDSFAREDYLEAFRILRANVNFLTRENDVSSIVVTSALPEEGKSTVAAWFAYASAVAGRRTLLVECDFRRPVLAGRFGVDKAPGLSDYLGDVAQANDVMRAVHVHGRDAIDVLPVIPAGTNTFQPTEMIGSNRFRQWLSEVTSVYDLVVLDSAPLLPVGDTLELIPQVDAILFCVRLGQTTREQAHAAKQAIQHLPEKPTGLVITGVRAGSGDDYYGYYSYTSGSQEPASAS
jgi:capsular exopolysaccharide synthesis family protein